jgi:hypothetical protein
LVACLTILQFKRITKVKIADPTFFIDSHRTTSTEHGEKVTTLDATLPSKALLISDLPFVPTTIKSTTFYLAYLIISSAAEAEDVSTISVLIFKFAP